MNNVTNLKKVRKTGSANVLVGMHHKCSHYHDHANEDVGAPSLSHFFKVRDIIHVRALQAISFFFALMCLSLQGCQKPTPLKQPIDFVAKLKACLPEYKKNSINNIDNVLKIKNVTSDYQNTTLTISIAASDKPLDFNLPIYVYSMGRWLINPDDVNGKDSDKGRAYLIDANCTQYKLKDREFPENIDKNGKLKLKAGQTQTINLTFTPLTPNTQMFLLMYGERVILFK